MNEANIDKDYEAAVIELRNGNRKGLLKFGAIVILTFMATSGILAASFSIGHAVGSAMVGDE